MGGSLKSGKMTKIIAISGEIGWDVWPDEIREQIASADGEDLEFQISSPGGYIYDGLEIFNLIKGYKGNTITVAIGMAASMASYLLMAGDVKKAAPNAIFMIHNARAFEYGDQNEHRRIANILDGMSNLLAREYINQTGKTKKEIQALMDDQSFFFGEEIKEAGFVDEIIDAADIESPGDPAADKSEAIANASAKVAAVMEKIKNKPEDMSKIAAILKPEAALIAKAINATGTKTADALDAAQKFSEIIAKAEPSIEKIKAATSSFKDYPISERAWDSSAAIQRVREKSNSTEEPSASYKNAFFWHDPDEVENFGGYKLPFVDVENDNYVAVKNGVDAAYAAMRGGRGGVNIPESDRPAVMAHIERYRRKIYGDEEPEDSDGENFFSNRQSANNSNKMEEQMPTLDEFLAGNPSANTEHDKRLGEAKDQGIQAKQEEINRIHPLITAEGASAALIEAGFKALKEGGEQVGVFVGIAEYEARQKEQSLSDLADKEQPEDTSPGPDPTNKERPKNPGDMKALTDDLKTKIL